MLNRNKYPRTKYFISKRFQGKFMCSIYLLVALVVVIFAAVFAMSTTQSMTITYDNSNLQLGSTPFILFKKLLAAGWILITILGCIAAVVALFQSHRIAGPLYKFELILDQMCRGILDPRVNIRKSDEAQEVIAKLQALNLFLAGKVTDIRRQVDYLEEEMKTGTTQRQTEAVQELKQILAVFEIKQ